MNVMQVRIVAAVAAAVLLWVLIAAGGALVPFALGAVIAYISAPMMAQLEKYGLSTAVAAVVMVVFWLLLLITLPVALLPLLIYQMQEISQLLPVIVAKVQAYFGDDIVGWLKEQGVGASAVDVSGAKQALSFLLSVGGQGLDIVSTIFAVLLITPLSTFYFLRDRKSIGGKLAEILPPRVRERVLLVFHDLDSVLSEFLHGQLLVMVIMSVIFSALLFFAQLKFALIIGVISGVLVFIPYVGFLLGLALATLVGLGEFDSWVDIVIVWVLLGIGTVLESIVITPRLVGERVGLHPLYVLLALFVMGGLFGFIGVLVALPVAAIVLVCCRHLRRGYINSHFYGHD